ncbi:hypothetical protein O181_063696 [Austropuccinia psidii MF-1]|uniref:Uncharacterized protein n=1 Tax=Austropuccinia psidii MF-1 TaxID=1389203 RepID=A0A9Q3EKH5_9BASI|nr:hypothetical protein [Austropuccinia psidii MF-1]
MMQLGGSVNSQTFQTVHVPPSQGEAYKQIGPTALSTPVYPPPVPECQKPIGLNLLTCLVEKLHLPLSQTAGANSRLPTHESGGSDLGRSSLIYLKVVKRKKGQKEAKLRQKPKAFCAGFCEHFLIH